MTKFKILWQAFLALFLGLVVYCFYPEDKLPSDIIIDQLIVHKSKRKLFAYAQGRLVKTYKIALGQQPIGKKEFEGDKKTPEGHYIIYDKNPNSGYHKNLGISYPNEEDSKNAQRLGKPAGGHIKIHGYKNNTGFIGKFYGWFDWTLGCIAVSNHDMDELYHAVKIGTPIEIKP